MPTRKRNTIGSWLDLARLAEELAGEEWIFRGEPAHGNPLRPGAGRLTRELRGRRGERFTEDDERAALERFKNDALPYLDFRPPSDHDLEWLAIAQHHGMQTRLLDWTESLLIAAFFAVESTLERAPGIIYGVRGLPLASATDDPFSLEEVSVYRPSHVTPRVAPQWSVFTVHPDPTADFRRSGLVTTWTIRGARNRWRIKLVLDSCGINYASIYPDLTGLAQHIYWRYKWGMSQTRPHAWRGSQPKERADKGSR
ncbi:MAG TPA: FRG domain-containing protein [Steroidobacteraceae bacterium]|nr:FRG domain-containing protein [Steroidobacteraceae bacterium]